MKEAYPISFLLLKGLSLRTKKRSLDTLKMSQTTDEEYLVIFGRQPLEIIRHAGFTPHVCWASLKPGHHLPGVDVKVGLDSQTVGGIGVGNIVAVMRVIIQVKIHKMYGHMSLETGSYGFYDRIGRFNREIDRLSLVVLIQYDRNLRKALDALLDQIPKGVRKFHGHGIRFDASKQVLDRTREL
jgi:hypothetical protein